MAGNGIADDVLLQGPGSTGSVRSMLIGCGGTGCNLIAEKVVDNLDTVIAMSSEVDVIENLKTTEAFLIDAKSIERDAKAMVKGSALHGTETDKRLGERMSGADIVFIIAGLGGYTGGWSAVLASRAAKRTGCLSICVVSEPFSVEGRGERAGDQLKMLMEHSDAVLVLPNDIILAEAPNLPIARAFGVMNKVLASPINQLSKCVGKDDMPTFEDCLAPASLFTMDVAEWDGTDAVYSVMEQLTVSKWLELEERDVASVILLIEGHLLNDDADEIYGRLRRTIGEDAKVLMGKVGPAEGLRVTAIVGYKI